MKLQGRKTDEWGNVIFDVEGLIGHLMSGNEFTDEFQAIPCEEILRFNQLCKELDHPEDQVAVYEPPKLSIEEWDQEHQEQWFTPEEFASIDVKEWLLEKCSTVEEVQRVLDEWVLFEERNMEPVLRQLIYLVDHFRKNNIVWGVGRGSSVASYSLYLIGIHKVNSIRFNLDPREFLK
jgi:DNA polymerase III alpha subunit